MRYKHILFDFDGTLLNTDQIIVESWQSVFRKYLGRELSLEIIFETFGETIVDTMKRMVPDADQNEAVAYYRSYQKEHYNGNIGLYPGMVDLIHGIHEHEMTVSIVTSRTKNTAMEYLEKLGVKGLFDVIITCDDTDAHKPSPVPLQIALEKLGASKEEALMLGDTKYDMGCAGNAGVDSVLVTWGHHADESKFNGFVPTYVVNTVEELEEIIY